MRESMGVARMSMNDLNRDENADRQLRIYLLSAKTVGGSTFYRIAGRFLVNGQTWEVNRRYSDFLNLRDRLIKFLSSSPDTCPGCLNYLHAIRMFEFPRKHLFASKTQMVINYRIRALRSFMNLLASWAFSNSPKCPTCGGFAFDIVKNFVLDGADPVTGSDMEYIRESFSVEAFTGSDRGSTWMRPSERRHSWIPASSSVTLRGAQEQQRQPPRSSEAVRRPQPRDDPYETFNDYLPQRPSQRKSGYNRSNTAPEINNKKFFASSLNEEAKRKEQLQQQQKQSYEAGSFHLYNENHSHSNKNTASLSSDGHAGKTAISKHRNEPPRNVMGRALGDSFLSAATSKDSEDRDYDESPSYSNPRASKRVQQRERHADVPARQHNAAIRQQQPLFDSFISDAISSPAEPIFVHGDEQRRYGTSPSDDEVKAVHITDDYSEDEIDITGVALASPQRLRPKASSADNLWQPWELAKAG